MRNFSIKDVKIFDQLNRTHIFQTDLEVLLKFQTVCAMHLQLALPSFNSPLSALYKSGALLENYFHRVLKFVVRDDPVIVLVDLSHDFIPNLFTTLRYVATAKDKPQLVLAYLAIAISIKHAEGALKVLTGQ